MFNVGDRVVVTVTPELWDDLYFRGRANARGPAMDGIVPNETVMEVDRRVRVHMASGHIIYRLSNGLFYTDNLLAPAPAEMGMVYRTVRAPDATQAVPEEKLKLLSYGDMRGYCGAVRTYIADKVNKALLPPSCAQADTGVYYKQRRGQSLVRINGKKALDTISYALGDGTYAGTNINKSYLYDYGDLGFWLPDYQLVHDTGPAFDALVDLPDERGGRFQESDPENIFNMRLYCAPDGDALPSLADFLPSMRKGTVYTLMCSAWTRDGTCSDSGKGQVMGRFLAQFPEFLTGPRNGWVHLPHVGKYMNMPFMMYNGKPKESVTLVFADEPIDYTIKEY